MRYVPSVAKVKEDGTDESFYMGRDFVPLPTAIVESIRKWCGESLPSATLGKEGPDDDPIEVYVLALGKSSEFTALKKVLRNILAEVIVNIYACPPKDVFARKNDAFFDTVRASAQLRDFILQVEGYIAASGRAGTIVDPAILIGI